MFQKLLRFTIVLAFLFPGLQMAFVTPALASTNYLVSGAGDTSYNGVYAPNGQTQNGQSVYQMGSGGATRYIEATGSPGMYTWQMMTTLNAGGSGAYGTNLGAPSITGPYTTQSGGTAPAPTVTLAAASPSISSVTPTTASVGSTVTLTGSGFTGATAVSVNGTNAPTFTVTSDTSLSFAVPFGASSGPISVTAPSGTGTSSSNLTVSPASQGQLTSRSLALGSSSGSASTTHQSSFTTGTSWSVGSVGLLYCTTASGSCTTPTGLSTTSAALSAQSGATGFTLVNATNGAPYLTRTAASLPASTAVSFTLSNVSNPSASNTSFYVRIMTYAGTDGASGAVDKGTVSASTGSGGITVSGTMDESLSFCAGTSISGTDCSTVSGSSVNFGTFSPTAPKTGTSVLAASTNGGSGYAIQVLGSTLSAGAGKTIPALTSQTASAPGTSQFGLNLALNTTPNVGTAASGSGTGAATANYATANSFRFVMGDVVASASGATPANAYTVSYLVNVSPTQAAGSYTASLTYICTAGF